MAGAFAGILYYCLMLKIYLLFVLAALPCLGDCQWRPDHVYQPSVHGIKLCQENNQEGVPVIILGSDEKLELHFDDLDAVCKNYYYTYQLCNADWQPAMLGPYDYIKGFQKQRISFYRVSSIAQTNYVHYQALLPDRYCVPTKSGNYVLKVFLNGDTAQLAFTRRFFVVESKATVLARFLQPFDYSKSKTHQKIQFSIDIDGLAAPNPLQQLSIAIVKNYRWDEAFVGLKPSFIRGNLLEYNGEQDATFEAGKEYRWADIRSLRFQSDKIDHIDKEHRPNIVYLRPETGRTSERYFTYLDHNGWCNIGSLDQVNPWWQTDYAYVTFAYMPQDRHPLIGQDVYVTGEFVQDAGPEDGKMTFNEQTGAYEATFLLKQGYYTYCYGTRPKDKPTERMGFGLSEGNYWETENDYCILVYYRSYSGRHDELVAFTVLNSRSARSGF